MAPTIPGPVGAPGLIDATVALADMLAEENRALLALDVHRAVALLARKQAASATFSAASVDVAALSPEQRALLAHVAGRLAEAATENRRLLERAIAVQGQVIATVARAMPSAAATSGGYGATGTRYGRAPPMALRARA